MHANPHAPPNRTAPETKGPLMSRQLCPTEVIYVAQRSRAVLSCSVRGDLDEGLFAEAFAAKLAEHPSLRCRIAQEDGQLVLQPLAEHEAPKLVVRPRGADGFAEEFNTPLPVGGPLVRAVLLRGEGTGDADGEHNVVLSVDHTITDGHSAIALFNAWWRGYTLLVEGRSLPTADQAGTHPVPVTELLPAASEQETGEYLASRIERARGRQLDFLPYQAVGTEQANVEGKLTVRRVQLSSERTLALRQTAKDEGVSVHGLVAAATLLAVQRQLGPDTRTLGLLSPVDLRTRLDPPLRSEVMVPAVASCVDVLEVTAQSDPLALARQVNDDLNAAIGRGDFLQELRIMPRLVEYPWLLATSVIVTNMGLVQGPTTPEGVEITDVRLVPARENYHPEAGRGPLMACVVSFDGRLDIEIPYSRECFTERQIDSVADELHRVLDGFAPFGESTATATAT
jgi:phenolphthiocerol/phthiocerol/phthiodiolone dimycocerosyl transferase